MSRGGSVDKCLHGEIESSLKEKKQVYQLIKQSYKGIRILWK